MLAVNAVSLPDFFFCLPAHSLPPPLPLLTPSFPPFRMLGCALRKTWAEGKELEEITAAKNGETPLGVLTLATCIPWGEGEGWRRPGGLDQQGGWSGRQSIERMSAKPLHPALTQFTPRHFLRTAPRIPWRRHHANRQLPAGAALGVFVLLKNGAVIVRACACVCAVEKERAFWVSLWAAVSDLHGSFFFLFFLSSFPGGR